MVSINLVSHSADSACTVPFANHGAYADLAAYGISPRPEIDGEGPFQLALASGGMPYYGGARRPTLHFTPNGAMSFDLESILAEGNGAHQPIPLDALPNALLAPLWTDMVLDQQQGGGVTVVNLIDINGVTVSNFLEFDRLLLASDPSNGSSIDLQVYIDSRVQADAPELVFAYANPTGDFLTLLDGTIGIENDDGSAGIELAHDDAGLQVGDGVAICFDLVPAGNVETLTYQATVDAFDGPDTVLTNTAVHTTDAPGTKPEATYWSVLASMAMSADLAVSIADAPDPVIAGGQIVYTIDIANLGAAAADAVTLDVTLPSGLTYAGSTGDGWSCTAGTIVMCSLAGALADAASAQLVLTADVAPGISGERTTSVVVDAATPDPVATNNLASATTTVAAAFGTIFRDGFED